jgi:putative transposase
MIDRKHDLPISRQAEALGVSRGAVYYKPRPTSTEDLRIMRRLDELHLDYPFAGSRMLRDFLNREGVSLGRRHVTSLMKRIGIAAIYRRPNTSKPAPGDKIYPYLLRGVKIERADQVWAMDITYIPMARGFVYLAAVVDVFSRRVLAHRVSITMEADFCIEALEEALAKRGKPDIFNSDQGSQGGFKWSSQQLDGSCDEHSKTALGSFWAGALVLTRSTAGGRARGAAAILGSDCGGHGE